MQILERLREVKGERTQQELAREWRLDQSSVSRILRGRQGISLRLGLRLMERYPELRPELRAALTGEVDDA